MTNAGPMRSSLLAVLIALAAVAPTVARGEDLDVARAHNAKAVAAYALGRYAEAAAEYEKAFELRPVAELLFNAAQGHRLAGNKQRALLLYQNYLRVFGGQINNRADVERHVAALQRALQSDAQVASAPPLAPEPVGLGPLPGSEGPPPARLPEVATAPRLETASTVAPAAPPPAPSPAKAEPPAAPPPSAPPAAVAVTPPRETPRPLTRRPLFWGIVGGAAALVAGGIIVGAVVGSSDRDPIATLGAVKGN